MESVHFAETAILAACGSSALPPGGDSFLVPNGTRAGCKLRSAVNEPEEGGPGSQPPRDGNTAVLRAQARSPARQEAHPEALGLTAAHVKY